MGGGGWSVGAVGSRCHPGQQKGSQDKPESAPKGGPSVPCLCASRLVTVKSIYVQPRAERRSDSFSCSSADWGTPRAMLGTEARPSEDWATD